MQSVEHGTLNLRVMGSTPRWVPDKARNIARVSYKLSLLWGYKRQWDSKRNTDTKYQTPYPSILSQRDMNNAQAYFWSDLPRKQVRPFFSHIRDHIPTPKHCPKAGTQKAMVERSSHNTDFSEYMSPSTPSSPFSPSPSSSPFLPSYNALSSISSYILYPSLTISCLLKIYLC